MIDQPALEDRRPPVPAQPSAATAPAAHSHPPGSTPAQQLLRSAVALQAEDILRTIGAMAQEQRDVREWVPLVERDVRDLAMLAHAAVAAGANLPAGFDGGGGDPDDPSSVMEGLLASHEALLSVLRHAAAAPADPLVQRVVGDVLRRREEEVGVLRGLGAGAGLPAHVRLVQGSLPKYH